MTFTTDAARYLSELYSATIAEHEDEDGGYLCPCAHLINGDSALSVDPRSWSAWDELDCAAEHLTGYDSFQDFEYYEVERKGIRIDA